MGGTGAVKCLLLPPIRSLGLALVPRPTLRELPQRDANSSLTPQIRGCAGQDNEGQPISELPVWKFGW